MVRYQQGSDSHMFNTTYQCHSSRWLAHTFIVSFDFTADFLFSESESCRTSRSTIPTVCVILKQNMYKVNVNSENAFSNTRQNFIHFTFNIHCYHVTTRVAADHTIYHLVTVTVQMSILISNQNHPPGKTNTNPTHKISTNQINACNPNIRLLRSPYPGFQFTRRNYRPYSRLIDYKPCKVQVVAMILMMKSTHTYHLHIRGEYIWWYSRWHSSRCSWIWCTIDYITEFIPHWGVHINVRLYISR